jgi:glyoxylase-like metal-dependent hydrolase (beta-lactamase superfamily II)
VLQVIHTPGHTLGHISLYAPDEQILILGDAVHGDDVAWINPFREAPPGYSGRSKPSTVWLTYR